MGFDLHIAAGWGIVSRATGGFVLHGFGLHALLQPTAACLGAPRARDLACPRALGLPDFFGDPSHSL